MNATKHVAIVLTRNFADGNLISSHVPADLPLFDEALSRAVDLVPAVDFCGV